MHALASNLLVLQRTRQNSEGVAQPRTQPAHVNEHLRCVFLFVHLFFLNLRSHFLDGNLSTRALQVRSECELDENSPPTQFRDTPQDIDIGPS